MDYSTEPFLNNEMLALIRAFVMLIGILLLFVYVINIYLPFRDERDYIKMEMARSHRKEDHSYWKKELIRLYLSLIPLIGRFFR